MGHKIPGPWPARRRRVAAAGFTPGIWHPELVGVVRGYPKSLEAYAKVTSRLRGLTEKARAEGKLSRQGVTNGWRGKHHRRAAEVEVIQRNAQTAAEKLVTELEVESADLTDDQMGHLALTMGLAFALDTTLHTHVRLLAMRAVLPFLLPLPARRAVLAAGHSDGGLGFLEGLAAEALGTSGEKD